jgi:hypothetical protein
MELLSCLQAGWNLRLGSQKLVIDAPSEGAAFDLLASAADQLALSIANLKFKDAQICWQGCKRPIRVLASMTNESKPTPEITDMVFSKHLRLDAFELNLLERMRASEKPMSICDLETDDQEWVNVPLTQMLQMTSDQACEQNMKGYWEEDALAYVKHVLTQQGTFNHTYEAMLPYAKAHFNSTFEVIEFGHPKRLKRLVTIHSYEPVRQSVMV